MEDKDRAGRRIRVIGCGNLLMGNDSAGLRVIGILEEVCLEVEVSEGGTGGIGLLPLMEDADLVIVVDAMIGIGESPGEIKIFYDTPPYNPSKMSFQDVGVAEVIEIARELIPGLKVIAIGIEAGKIDHYRDGVDPLVMDGINKAVDLIKEISSKGRLPDGSGF